MEECNEKRDGWGEDDTSNKRLDIGRLVGAGSSTGDDEGCWGVRGAKAGACLQPAPCLARRRLLSLPSTLPPRHFVLGQGRGSRARAGALCPRPQGALRVPLGHPGAP